MKKTIRRSTKTLRERTKLNYADEFYRKPCWLDLWRDNCNPCLLTFWSRIDETNAAILISYWFDAGFLTRTKNRTRYQVHSTYYSQLKFYTLKGKTQIPGTKKLKAIQNSLHFQTVCQRIWMSMRILQTFSIGQLQACSSAGNDLTRTFVNQLYQLNYIRLKVCYGSIYEINEDIYQLIRDTGVKPPFLCGEGSLYDLNTQCVYFTD
jgi:hypothetical protein